MVLFNMQKMQTMAVATAMMFCCIASGELRAATVTYAASGTLNLISGSDAFRLDGEPFSINVTADPSMAPTKNGQVWAAYAGLKMSATVQSALVPTPITLSNSVTSLLLENIPNNINLIQIATPLKVINLNLKINAVLKVPLGTLTTLHIYPFSSVALTPAMATVTYSEPSTGQATTLGITGTVAATASAAATTAGAIHLESAGARSVTTHEDGTQTVRSIHAAPVDLTMSKDLVHLEFYASGVRSASNVRVQIGGVEVPVRYAGPSRHFPSLDEVRIELPHNLASRGEVEVTMTADGQTSSPVRIRVQ